MTFLSKVSGDNGCLPLRRIDGKMKSSSLAKGVHLHEFKINVAPGECDQLRSFAGWYFPPASPSPAREDPTQPEEMRIRLATARQVLAAVWPKSSLS